MNDIRVPLRGSEPLSGPEILVRTLRDDLAPFLRSQAAEADAAGTVTPASWEAVRRSGLLEAPLDRERGGLDLNDAVWTDTLLDVLRLLGGADLSLARLFEGHVNALGLVARYGTPAQADDLARSVREGGLSAVWGADDARGLHADREGTRLRLRGRKVLASGAGLVARPLVTAATAEGQVMLLLDLAPGERADVSGWTAQGMRSSATGAVDLDGLVIEADRIVGSPGDFMRQPTLSGGAWRFCAAHLGAAERLVDLFREGLVSRGRGDDPFQLQRIALCVGAVGSAAFWIGEAGRRLADATPERAASVVAFANLTRMVTERACLDVLEAVHRGAGLASFLRPNPMERVARDLATYLRQPVPDLAMTDAARAVLASPRSTATLWALA